MATTAKLALGAAVLCALAAAPPAFAVDELYVGVLAHNIAVIDDKNADKEDGPDVEAQLNFDSPSWLGWAGSPHPYIVANLNTAGETSHAGVGLEWHWAFAEGWRLSPGLGYVVHNGELENPYVPGTPESTAFANEHVLLGSEDLFRTSLGLSRDIGENLSLGFVFVHLSHGQILGNGRNQGMDEAGVRLGWRFE